MPKKSIRDFTPIKSEEIVHRYLLYATDLRAHIQCHVQETDINFTTRARHIDGLNIELRHPADQTDPEILLDKINQTATRTIDISYKIDEISIFATTDFLRIDKKSIFIRAKPPIYKLQRRDHLRVKPGSDIHCYVVIPPDNIAGSERITPSDISTGGFALILPEDEAEIFEKNMSLNQMQCVFGDIKTMIDAKVMSNVALKNSKPPMHKIGFAFKKLPNQLDQAIVRYAYRHSQRIWSRRMNKK